MPIRFFLRKWKILIFHKTLHDCYAVFKHTVLILMLNFLINLQINISNWKINITIEKNYAIHLRKTHFFFYAIFFIWLWNQSCKKDRILLEKVVANIVKVPCSNGHKTRYVRTEKRGWWWVCFVNESGRRRHWSHWQCNLFNLSVCSHYLFN